MESGDVSDKLSFTRPLEIYVNCHENTTVNDLTHGSRYTITVWASGYQGLRSKYPYLKIISHLFNCLNVNRRGVLLKVGLLTLVFACFYIAPRIEGQCEYVSSTTRSLTFRWAQAKSATSYRLAGHSKSASNVTNSITLNGLTPGSRYTFTVWAVGWQGRVSNNITCTGSTGLCEIFTARCYASAVLAVAPCLSQVGVLLKRLNVGSHKQQRTIAQGL